MLSVDQVGPFVLQGFNSLKALSRKFSKPFSADRDGLVLGEAAVVLVLSKSGGGPVISGVAIDSEGKAVTRPGADSLRRAIKALPGTPDLIIAHATGTLLNDSTEDAVFFELFGERPLVTGSKWSVGHTLGASGAVDIVLACEAIRRQSAFRLANTFTIDPSFRSRYLRANSDEQLAPEKVMVSSLGFGGIHAAAMIERRRD